MVNIGGGIVPNGVFGGFSFSDSSENNTVTVEQGGANIGAIRGGYVENGPGNANLNSVNVKAGSVNQAVTGGMVAGGTGSANQNTVTITGSGTRIGNNVAGGFSISGGVSKNEATIGAGVNVSANIRGGNSVDGDVTENTVTMTGTTVGYDVFGGQSTTGNVSKNTVAIQNGIINSNGLLNMTGTFGGRSDSGNVDGNTLTLTGSAKAYDFVGGGISATGAVTNNNVFVKDTVAVGTNSNVGGVVGGWVTQGSHDATGNGATVTGGTVKGSLIGGRVAKRGSGTATGNATSNSVTLSGGSVAADAVGGYSERGSANENSAILSGGSIGGQAMGGYSAQGSANENRLTISGSSITSGIAVGGYSAQGVANSNIVTMTSGTVNMRDLLGGYGGGSAANSNIVTMQGGTVAGDAIGGRGAGTGATANENRVTMSGGEISGDILGGWSLGGAANKNIVTVTSGTVGYDIYGGFDNGGGAGNENSVTMTGGTVAHFIYGGKSSGLSNKNSVTLGGNAIAGSNTSSMVYGGYSTGANATENTVTVNGATAKGSVYGGYSNIADATGNSVTLNTGTIGGTMVGGVAIGAANQNSVTMSSGSVAGIRGGLAQNGIATGNTVSIQNGTVTGDIYGGQSNAGSATDNAIIVDGGTINGTIAGGLGNTQANGNSITINGGTINGNIFGGYSSGGKDAIKNTVTISGSANLANSILAGGVRTAGTGDVFTGNTLNVDGFKGDVQGISNFENINFILSKPLQSGDTVLRVLGAGSTAILNSNIGIAFSDTPLALQVGNSATLIDATAGGLQGAVNREITLGTSAVNGLGTYTLSTANNKLDLFVNKLEINNLDAGAAYSVAVGSGLGQWAELKVNNNFKVKDFTMASSAANTANLAVGGLMAVESFTATKNSGALSVNVDTLDVTGQNTTLHLNGTTPWDGTTGILFNTIALGGEKTLTLAGTGDFDFKQLDVYGKNVTWDGELNAAGKEISFVLAPDVGTNDTMLKVMGQAPTNITGCSIDLVFSDKPVALKVGKSATLIDATAGSLLGNVNREITFGTNAVNGLWTYTLSTANNKLDLFANKLEVNNLDAGADYSVVAGTGLSQWAALKVNKNLSAKDFTIASSATNAADLAVGGLMAVESFTATNNNSPLSVNVDTLDVTGQNTTLNLNGTTPWNGTTGILFNTIALGGEKTLTLAGTGDFDFKQLDVHGKNVTWDGDLNGAGKKFSFFLTPDVGKNDTLLTVTGTTGTNITGCSISMHLSGGAPALEPGDKIQLIDVQGALLNGTPNSLSGSQGISLLYDFTVSQDEHDLYGTVNRVGLNPQTKALPEGRILGLAFVNQGSTLLAEDGVRALRSAAIPSARFDPEKRIVTFGTMGVHQSRINAGPHIEAKGVSLIAGMAWDTPLPANSLLLGTFFENGKGKYTSHNNVSNTVSVKGSGDTEYSGGGILGRYDVTEGLLRNLYTEMSLRAGYTSTDFSSNDLRDATGHKASYNSGAVYSGGHTGLGYAWQLNEKATLDFSTKHLWTHLKGDSVTVTGDPIQFKASDSQRWRNGVRFSYAPAKQFSPYIGAALDYEFDGKARATTHGYAIEPSSLKGSTVMSELGADFYTAESNLSLNFAVQRYTGKREGVSGNMSLKYAF